MSLPPLAESVLLGLIQGLTEFLPVSSSGHLALAQQWMGWRENPVAFDLVLHLGTLVPVIGFYRKDLVALARSLLPGGDPAMRRMVGWLFAASVPTAAIGLAFKETFEAAFSNPIEVPIELAITGVLLYATKWFQGGRDEEVGYGRAILIGIAQGISATPGISRSGATIATGLMTGLSPQAATRFSFLASIPVIAGAIAFEIEDAFASPVAGLTPSDMAIGAVVAGVVGYVSLVWLVKVVARGRIVGFAWYLWAISALSLTGTLLVGTPSS